MSTPRDEIRLFEGLWKGGYFLGDPLDPAGENAYGEMGFISVLHAIYKMCIAPYIKPDTVVLEIGPGRGAWTKTMLQAKEIWCMDALSARHNNFWQYVGEDNKKKIKYIQAKDFSCKEIPDDHFDFFFSYAAFCHITWEGQCQYYKNLYPKMRQGGNAMLMNADFDKYNSAIRNFRQFRVRRVRDNPIVSDLIDIVRHIYHALCKGSHNSKEFQELDKNDTVPEPGKWYHAGTKETCQFLESVGWEIIEQDIGLCHRDPIIHFRKPL